jgi:iron complex outermembrane receptor protein
MRNNLIFKGFLGWSVVFLGLAEPLMAQTAGTEKPVELPPLYVTASPIVRRPAQPAPTQVTITPQAEPQGTAPIVTDQFATVTVVPTEEIMRRSGATLGDMLFSKPGITGSTYAPGGASRPIVRGLDNYRVRMQENGLATSDVSDLSEDHAVPIDPLAAHRVEVIRGPATLRFGSQAIGGVVNVDNNRIPTSIPRRGVEGEVNAGLTSVERSHDGSVLLDAGDGNVAVHADWFGRNAQDYAVPRNPYLLRPDLANTINGRQPNSFAQSNGGALGGSYIFDRGFVGIAVSQFNSLYGISGIEGAATNTRIDLRQNKITGKGEFRPESGVIEAVRFWLGASDYRHDEIGIGGDGIDAVQQTFTNKGEEGRLEVQLAPFDVRFATLTTALGVQVSQNRLAAPGPDGFSGGLFDPNRTTSIAAYLFNEFRFNEAFRMQVAGRIEQVDVKGTATDFPADFLPGLADPVSSDAALRFMPKSGSIGFLHDLPWGMVGSITAQYVERAPRAPELFSRGAHDATATFEIGNPNLTIESAKGVEVGLRRKDGPFRFEATVYHTEFSNFIFKRLTGVQCGGDFASCGTDTELNQIVYSQRDATFRGGEIAAQLDIAPLWTGVWGIEGQYDIVRATFADGSNVPRIPPQRIGGGLFWRDANWLARINLLHASSQNDFAANETPTPEYNLLKAELSYTTALKPADFGARSLTVGLVGNNLLNDDIRNAASFKKDEVLLPGASVRGFVRVGF